MAGHTDVQHGVLIVVLAGTVTVNAAMNSFSTTPGCGDSDLRMVYCAFAISSMLGDWRGVDVPKAFEFIKRCRVRMSSLCLLPSMFVDTEPVRFLVRRCGIWRGVFCVDV